MSLFTPEIETPPPSAARLAWLVRRSAYARMAWGILLWLLGAVRALIGMTLCAHHFGALIVSGWTFRLMRLRILKGLWLTRRVDRGESFEIIARRYWPDAPASTTPRFFVAERWRERMNRPTPAGKSPFMPRQIGRGFVGLFGSLAANLGWGLTATLCTFALTCPGLLLLLGAWEYGWSTAFHHSRERAFVAPTIGCAGISLFAASMLYVPMAWAHLAATGDPRAILQGRLISRLVRRRLGAMTAYALVFTILCAPTSLMWALRSLLPLFAPGLEDAPPERVAEFAARYAQSCGVYLFLAFVASHLLVARVYRSAMLSLLARDPSAANDLPPNLASFLGELGHVPEAVPESRATLARIALGTSGWLLRSTMWIVSAFLWASVAGGLFFNQWFVYHEYLVWLNPPLIHLPSLYLAVRG